MPELAERQRITSFHLSRLSAVATELISAMADTACVVLRGEMGSGKTTLVKEIGHQLGVTETMASPTFSIVNEYESVHGNTIFHFDFYRLKNETEALDMGVEEYFDSGSLCLIEWPERIPNLLPNSYFEIELRQVGTETREIRYGKH
jgi:tRNA threonylcarbamoyladenosine biosynthesis protein TsaE